MRCFGCARQFRRAFEHPEPSQGRARKGRIPHPSARLAASQILSGLGPRDDMPAKTRALAPATSQPKAHPQPTSCSHS